MPIQLLALVPLPWRILAVLALLAAFGSVCFYQGGELRERAINAKVAEQLAKERSEAAKKASEDNARALAFAKLASQAREEAQALRGQVGALMAEREAYKTEMDDDVAAKINESLK